MFENKQNNIYFKLWAWLSTIGDLVVIWEWKENLIPDFTSEETWKQFKWTVVKFKGWVVFQTEIVNALSKNWKNIIIDRAVEACPMNWSSVELTQSPYKFDEGDYFYMNFTAWDIKDIISIIQAEETARITANNLKLNNSTHLWITDNYTFDGSESNNTIFWTSTSSWDITYNLDLSLFNLSNWLYRFTFIKSTSDSNKVIIDVWVWNTIDWNQTYILTNEFETVTIEIVSSSFSKIIATSNKATSVDINSLEEKTDWDLSDLAVIYSAWNKKISVDNFVNTLKTYQLNTWLSNWDLVQLLNTWKVDALDLVSFSGIQVSWPWYWDWQGFNIFRVDDDHFCVLSWYTENWVSNYWTTVVYGFWNDWVPIRTQWTTLTTSVTSSNNSSAIRSDLVNMWNNFFVFLYQDNNWYIRATISEFNSSTWSFTHWSMQTIDISAAYIWQYINWCRMTDSTLLVQHYWNRIRKVTINTWTKTITTAGAYFTITGSSWNTQWPIPITSWWEDIWAVVYHKNVSWLDIYACKITCTWHDIAFSEETELYNPWTSWIYIQYWVNNMNEHWWDWREMIWAWYYNNYYWRLQKVRYDDVNWFEFWNVLELWYYHRPNFLSWYSVDKIAVSVYDYDWTSNGRYIYHISISDLTVSKTWEYYITSNTYQRKVIWINWGFMYVWNDQSANLLYMVWIIQDISKFFWILKETWLTNEYKKVARYWNISKWHTWLTPWKEFWYWRAINDTDILLYKNS